MSCRYSLLLAVVLPPEFLEYLDVISYHIASISLVGDEASVEHGSDKMCNINKPQQHFESYTMNAFIASRKRELQRDDDQNEK